MITAKNYIHRRRSLAEAAEQPLIVVTGSDLVQKSSDETYDFEQDGYFYYLTGIEEPGWMLVMDVMRGEEFLVSTEESSYHSDVWEVKLTNDQIVANSGISEIKDRKSGWAFLRNNIENYQSIGSIVPRMRFSRPFGMFINPSKTLLVERLRRLHSDANLIDISQHIRALRSVKEPEEIAEIKKAVAITEASMAEVLPKLDMYTSEAEIHSDLTYAFMKRGSDHGYRPVIASGKNAAILHYKENNRPITKNAYLLMDFGAKSSRYTADVTRVFPIGNVPTRHQDVYRAVAEVQNEAFNFLKPGVTMRGLESHVEQSIGKKLNELGIIDSMLRKHIRDHYPHAVSHHLGIDVHDSCDYNAPLQPGAVITIEPGIYIQDEGIGVRLEEDVLITNDGYEVLTKGVGKR